MGERPDPRILCSQCLHFLDCCQVQCLQKWHLEGQYFLYLVPSVGTMDCFCQCSKASTIPPPHPHPVPACLRSSFPTGWREGKERGELLELTWITLWNTVSWGWVTCDNRCRNLSRATYQRTSSLTRSHLHLLCHGSHLKTEAMGIRPLSQPAERETTECSVQGFKRALKDQMQGGWGRDFCKV